MDRAAEFPSLAGYRIEAVAGRGGMGIVYRAVQEDLGRPVALKLIAPELARDSEFRARFVRESRLAASLDHPHVIPVYEAGEADGSLYIAMRWVDGPDLRELIASAGPLPAARAAALIAQVADGLDAAHARGLVHRDVKPANVLLGDGDHAYLSDFGLALSGESADRLTRTGAVIGTASYASPEQIEGRPVDARSDVYALACVLYFALTGAPPFRRDTELGTAWAQVHDAPPLVPGAAPALNAAVARGLAKDPADRPPSASGFAREVSAAAKAGAPAPDARAGVGGAPPGGRPPGGAPSGGRPPGGAPSGGRPSGGAPSGGRPPGGAPSGGRPSGGAPSGGRPPGGAPPGQADASGTVRLHRTGQRRRVLSWLAAFAVVAGVVAVVAVLSLSGDDPDRAAERRPATAPRTTTTTTPTTTEQRTTPAGPRVPMLTGERLNVAEDLLDQRGIEHATDGGGAFGVVVAENWVVCETSPPAGELVRGRTVTLAIARSC